VVGTARSAQSAPPDPQSLSARASDLPEREILKDGNILVTNARFVVGSQTYAIRNITSAAVTAVTPQRAGGQSIGCGAMAVLFAIMGLAGTRLGDEVTSIIVAFLLPGLVAVVWGIIIRRRQPLTTYHLTLVTSAGQQSVIRTPSREYVDKVAAAINQSIART